MRDILRRVGVDKALGLEEALAALLASAATCRFRVVWEDDVEESLLPRIVIGGTERC
jgi:hypothetical protein